MTLTGRLRGSAALIEAEGETRIKLSVRGLRTGMSLFTVSGGRILRTAVTGSELSVKQTGVCAAVLSEHGRLVSGGFTGECGANRDKLLDEIRIRAAEPEAPLKKAPDKKEPDKPRAAVTESIIDRAQRLFSMLEELSSPAERPKADPRPELTPVPNPFPKTFPNSVWRMREGDRRLFGEVISGGDAKNYIAVPIDVRGRSSRPGNLRPIVGRDGRRYLVEAMDP